MISKSQYEKELARLQTELVRMQEWVIHEGLRVMVIFEGRDTAGKGGTIKRIIHLIIVIIVILWLLQVFGLMGPINRIFH